MSPSTNATEADRAGLPCNDASGQGEATIARAAAVTAAAPSIPPGAVLHHDRAPIAGVPEIDRELIAAHSRRGQLHMDEALGPFDIADTRANHSTRLVFIVGIGLASAIVVGLTLKAAGCSYAELQWPITIIVAVTGMFLGPAYGQWIA